MENIISVLSDSVANQIAAGEVVQRPASVIKELLENAIDAKATKIKVILKDAGKTLIQVIDNGIGMSPVDARMAFERHATSKIKIANDLFDLHTKGFRGEALASICSIAYVELKTKREKDELGQYIIIEGNRLIKQESCQTGTGSSFTIKNLFYNTPARRHFLKNDNIELKHILDEIERVAIPHYNIEFIVFHNDHELMNLPSATLIERLMRLLSSHYKDKLVAINENIEVVNFHGYVGKPEVALKSKRNQFFFVNNRYIKSPYLNHAIHEAYKGLISDDKHVNYFLFLDVNPKFIDVNIHPSKTEIKFQDEKVIYALLLSTVKRAIGKAEMGIQIDFEPETAFNVHYNKPVKKPQLDYNPSYNPFQTDVTFEKTSIKQNNLKNWETLYEKYNEDSIHNAALTNQTLEVETDESLQTQLNIETEVSSLFQLQLKYIVTPFQNGLYVIDQQRAHEQILFEYYFSSKQPQNTIASQKSLFPTVIELSVSDYELVQSLLHHFLVLGFELEPFGKNTFSLQGTPANLSSVNFNSIIDTLIENYKLNSFDSQFDPFENICKSLAKSTCIGYGKKLTHEEMSLLVNQLFMCQTQLFNPTGKPIIMELSTNTIDKFFKK